VKHALLYLALALASAPLSAFGQTEAAKASTDGHPSAEAASPPASAAEQAREFGRAGLLAYGQFEFELALGHFERAEELMHSPVFQLYAARCLASLGRVPEARSLLERITREALPTQAPEAWQRAQSEAEHELAALTTAPAEPNAHAPEPSPPFDVDGRVTQTASGESAPSPPELESPAPKGLWARATPNQRGAVVAFGVGAAGVVLTVVTGALAIAEAAAVKENCVGTSCRPEDLPRAQHAETLANLATVGGTIALAGGVTGALLLWLPDAARPSQVTLAVSGASLRLSASF